MKMSKLFLLSLVIASTGIAQLQAMEHHASYSSVNPDLVFAPNDPEYYAIIEQELKSLTDYLEEINENTEWVQDNSGMSYKPSFTEIIFTENPIAQKIAPKIYQLLSAKIHVICNRMQLDASTTTISIDPDDLKYPIFNAFHRPKNCFSNWMHDGLIFHVALIKSMLWHEGSEQFHQAEGLLDAIIAHELAHNFHKHRLDDRSKSIFQEFEADRTGAQCLQLPENMICAQLFNKISSDLFDALINYSGLSLSKKDFFSIVCILSSTMIKKYPDLGALGNCTSHALFAYNINKAVEVIQKTKYAKKYSVNSYDNLEKCDLQNICSLIYDELVARCTQIDLIPENYDIYNPMTHPAPLERKAAIFALILEQKQTLF